MLVLWDRLPAPGGIPTMVRDTEWYPIATADPSEVLSAVRLAADVWELRRDDAGPNHLMSALRRDVPRILDAIGEAVIATELDGTITSWNRAATELYGWTRDEAIGRSILDMTVYDGTLPAAREIMDELAQGRTWSGSFTVRHKSGALMPAHVTDAPLFAPDGTLTGIVGISFDVSHHVAELADARRREAIFAEAQALGKMGHYVFDVGSGRWTHSHQLDEVFGIPADYDATVDGWLNLIHPDDRDSMAEYLATAVLRDGKTFDRRYRIIDQRSRETKWVHGRGRLEFAPDGHVTTMLGTIQDITEMKRAEQQLQDLIRETNHRVKNNLMTVSALLSLKEDSLPETVDLSDVRGQLHAIQHVHDLLSYRSTPTDRVSLHEYLSQIVVAAAASAAAGPLRPEILIDDVEIPARSAVLLGLITNEITTNAAKYGAVEDGTTFRVEGRGSPDRYRLVFRNDGPPIPEHVDLETGSSLGIRLIRAISAQLNGDLEIDRGPNPEFRLEFSL